MPWTDYVEKELIGKRFIIALLLVILFATGHISEGILGAVIGFYFRDHISGGGSVTA
jgi:hypothetical protein